MSENRQGEIGAVTIGILAGGKSARMGSDKALLVWQGKPMIGRLIDRLGCGRPVLISASQADEKRLRAFSCPVVVDERAQYGPLEGIYRLLLAAETDWTFLVATDLPFVDEELIDCLCRHAGAKESEGRQPDIVVPQENGRVHPLCGLYHRRVLPLMEQLFERGEHRVRALLSAAETVCVPAAVCGLDPRIFWNVNTPEQFRALERSGVRE